MRRALYRGRAKARDPEEVCAGVWETVAVASDGCWANAIIPTVRPVGSLSPQTILGRIQSQTCFLAKPDVVRLLHTAATCAAVCTLPRMGSQHGSGGGTWL